jgi:hypothetical protein
MKAISIIILVSLGMLARAEDKLFDDQLAKNAVAVLRIEHSQRVLTNNNICQFYMVWPTKVFKNESAENLYHTFPIRVLNGKAGIPPGECTIYMERYSFETKTFNKTNGQWFLVGGDSSNGVSHVKSNKPL